MINDKLWESLYWTAELTRPDRLAKVLNLIIRKEDGDSERFIYDRQAAKDAMKVGLSQHDISQTDVSQHGIFGVNVVRNDIDHFKSLKQNSDRVHLTHYDKRRLEQLDKLFDSYSRSSSSSNAQNYSDTAKSEFELFDWLKLGGSFSGATQTPSGRSDNRADINDKQHEKVSDVNILNVTDTDKRNLNVLNIERNHWNTTRIDKERSINTQINNNNLNQLETNTNNSNVTKTIEDTAKQHTLSRKGVEKFLLELSDNVYLEGDIIKPRPINIRLLKIEKFKTNTKLFSTTVLVRMRSNVHVLPLRCKPDGNGGKSKRWLTDRVDHIENVLLNLSSHGEITKLHDEIRNMQDNISVVENKIEQMCANWKQEIYATSSNTTLKIYNIYTNLTRIEQDIVTVYSKTNAQINNLYTNLTDMMKQEINAASSKVTVQVDNIYTNLTGIKQNIVAVYNKTNAQIDNLYTNLTAMLQQKIDAASNKTSIQIDKIYTHLNNTTKQVRQIIWTDTFTNGIECSSAQKSNWTAFVASLTSRNYTKVTINGTFDTTGRTCNDSVVATSLANSLNTHTDYISASACNGNVWHNCASHQYEGEVWLNPPSSCSPQNCPTGYIIRPNTINRNWGGVNTTTCDGPTQQMTFIFEY